MVRSIAGVLADVSRGKAPPTRGQELLRAGDRRKLSPKAPAKGLTLLRVGYGMGSGLEIAAESSGEPDARPDPMP
jgi:tRNA pseudouridine38-40 synthase